MSLDISIQTLFADKLPATKGTLYTVPVGRAAAIKSFTLSNTAGADRTVNIYVKKSGGVSTAIVPKNYTFIGGDQADVLDGSAICLAAGDSIEGECVGDGTGVDCGISGIINIP